MGNAENQFKVRVGEFEGPLDVLLDLIEKRKLHINSVSLSEVADDFLKHIEGFEEFPMADSADFILIASTLLLIKSKSLLPNISLTEEEEGSIDDLELRLVEYKRYKALAQGIQNMFGNFLYFAEESKIRPVVFLPTKELSVAVLHQYIKEVLRNIPKTAILPKVTVEKVVSLEEMIDSLTKRVADSFRTSFKEFTNDKMSGPKSKQDRLNVIVGFLALLELVKRGAVRAEQHIHFEDIEIESEKITTPIY